MTKAVFCSTLIRASSFIVPNVYDALLIGMGAVSLMVFLFLSSLRRAHFVLIVLLKANFFLSVNSFFREKVVLYLRRLLTVG